jgi:hypothetical protein
MTPPDAFREMPILYERSFGGWDRSDSDPEKHSVDVRNPVGRGFQSAFAKDEDLLPLPNIEDPRDLIGSMKSRPAPVGFGFVNPDWQPRVRLAGTYDDAWMNDHMPALPPDFDPCFFNAASPGLVAEGYLIGNEPVSVTNCCGRDFLRFDLPGVQPPCCRFRLAGLPLVKAEGRLDTVVVNALEDIVTLTWRCHARLPGGPEQLRRLRVSPS